MVSRAEGERLWLLSKGNDQWWQRVLDAEPALARNEATARTRIEEARFDFLRGRALWRNRGRKKSPLAFTRKQANALKNHVEAVIRGIEPLLPRPPARAPKHRKILFLGRHLRDFAKWLEDRAEDAERFEGKGQVGNPPLNRLAGKLMKIRQDITGKPMDRHGEYQPKKQDWRGRAYFYLQAACEGLGETENHINHARLYVLNHPDEYDIEVEPKGQPQRRKSKKKPDEELLDIQVTGGEDF